MILAGGRCDPEFAAKTGCEYRGDVPFLGRTMTEIALDATRSFGSQTVVGPCPDPEVRSVPAGSGYLESLEAGLAEMGEETLLVTADLPLLRPEHVASFLNQVPPGVEVCIPVIDQRECERVAPGVPRTTIALREGSFTAGNILWARTDALRKLLPRARQGYDNRKSPMKLAQLLGPAVLGKLLLARFNPRAVSVASLAEAASRQIGVDVRAIIVREAEIGTDVDRYEQLEALLALKT